MKLSFSFKKVVISASCSWACETAPCVERRPGVRVVWAWRVEFPNANCKAKGTTETSDRSDGFVWTLKSAGCRPDFADARPVALCRITSARAIFYFAVLLFTRPNLHCATPPTTMSEYTTCRWHNICIGWIKGIKQHTTVILMTIIFLY